MKCKSKDFIVWIKRVEPSIGSGKVVDRVSLRDPVNIQAEMLNRQFHI